MRPGRSGRGITERGIRWTQLPEAQAAFVEWHTGHGLMTVHRWSPRKGYSQFTRTYP
jgi:hypothetical protein